MSLQNTTSMEEIKSCTFISANFFYNANPLWKHAPRTIYSPNNLILVTEGVLHIMVQDQKYTINQGECLFLPAGIESIGYRPSSAPTAFYCAIFNASPEFHLPTKFLVGDMNIVRDKYVMLIKAAASHNYPKTALNLLLQCLIYETLYQLNNESVAENCVSEEGILPTKIKEYINGTLFRNITVQDIADHFGFSVDYIIRVFSLHENITPKAYINHLKIKRIEELLMSTNTSLSVIAKKMGFPNSAMLSKFYKYHTGRTTNEYRSKFIN